MSESEATRHLTSQPSQPWVEIDEAVQILTTRLCLCPNRVWAVARSLSGRERNLPFLIPSGKTVMGHRGHDQCTFDFCEHSRRDFTAVPQRHEPAFCQKSKMNRESDISYPCHQLKHCPQRELEAAISAGKQAVWKLDGMAILPRPEPFMAISHVWSDGTGMGAWAGGVNECLYSFFRGVAERFQCKGIWWDTISIPTDKAARTKAINQMESNYEDASVTFVHDCYIRDSRWVDAETACFTIIMSPWFSRGWTALELARSQTVKIMFKDSIIKDLDEDILSVVGEDCRAQVPIRNLRKKDNLSLNELLTALTSRYTSWPRDVASISALLTGINVVHDEPQQSTYQRVLMKIGRVRHEHLFHNSATMTKGFSWCPTALVDMAPSSPDHLNPVVALNISQSGAVTGTWQVIRDRWLMSQNWDRYNWKGTHPLIIPRLKLGLASPECHVLLAEPDVDSIERALLVKQTTTADVYQYIGSVYFRPPLELRELGDETVETREVTIGDPDENIHDAGLEGVDQVISQESQPQQLLEAASKGDREQVERLTRELPSLDFQDEHSWTALQYATWRGHTQIVRHLVQNKACRSVRDALGQQALHLATRRGNKTIACLLLGETDKSSAVTADPDIDLESIDKDGRTPLSWAAGNGKQSVMSLLLERGAKHSSKDESGRTPISWASGNGQEKSIKKLLQIGADFDEQDIAGHTPLSWAARNGEAEAANILLLAGSNLESIDQSGRTPLSWAAGNGHNPAVRLLLEENAKLETKDHSGRTPLSWAAEGWRDTVEILLQKGALLESKDRSGRTPLSWAAQSSEDTSRLLLERNAELDSMDESGRTPLSWAASSGFAPAVNLLLDHGAELELQDDLGWTPLSWAAEHEHASLVHLMLSKGAKLEASHSSTQTLLLSASRNRNYNMVKLLHDEGVPLNIPDHLGRTPFSYAAQNGDLLLINLLLEGDVANLYSKDKFGRTSISFAAEHGQTEVIKLFLNLINTQENNDINTLKTLPLASTEWKKNRAEIIGRRESPDDSGRDLLSWAAGSGQQAVVDLLLRSDFNLESYDNSFWTPLTWAANNEQGPMVTFLAERGAKIDPQDELGNTPLHHAAMNGKEDMVRLLLDHGAEVDSWGHNSATPLSAAAGNGHQKIMEILLVLGAQIESRDYLGRTPLSWAAGNGQEVAVETLLGRGAELESCDNSNKTPLSWASETGHENMMKLLLEKGADLEFRDISERTPLSWAAGNGQLAATVLLLEKGAELNSRDSDSKTPYLLAAEGGHLPVVQLLIEKGVDLESTDNCDLTALYLAASNGHEAVVQLLLEHGSQVEGQNPIRTPLLVAAENGHCAVAKLLLDNGAQLEFRDNFGRTPLSWAAGNSWIIAAMMFNKLAFSRAGSFFEHIDPGRGLDDVVQLLLHRGADSNLRDNTGRMPVSWAAQNGKESMLKMLLDINPDVECEDDNNRTLVSWAAEGGHTAIIELLLARNAKLDSRDKSGRTPLSYAAAQDGWGSVVELLLDHGAELESRDNLGRTPLSWTAKTLNTSTAQVLVSKGADIESEDCSGWTPLFWAVNQEQESSVRFLLEKGASWKEHLDKSGQGLSTYVGNCTKATIQGLFHD